MRGGIEQVGEEGLAGRLVLAEREDLLELVDQQDQPARRRGVAERQAGGQVQRVLGRSQGGHQSLDRDRRGPGAPSRPASATARLSIGSRPGLKMTIGHSALPSSAPPFRAATSPARASDDLPLPEAPRIARKRFSWPEGDGPQLDDQPLGQRLAAEEERGVLDVEDLQPAVGARALEGARRRGRRRLDAPDAADQPVEGLLIVERRAELDPGRRGQERGQRPALGPVGSPAGARG